MSPTTWRNTRNGLLFASPWLVGFVLFYAYPIVASLYYSFTRYSVLRAPIWIGLANYGRLLTDRDIHKALFNTLYMVAIAVPLGIVASVALAILLNEKLKGMSLYRTLFYLPSTVPILPKAILWMWMLNPKYGLLAQVLGVIGLKSPNWFADPAWAKPALILMGLWDVGSSMIIYLAGLQDVPEHLYDAAKIDGANTVQRLSHVTLPMLTPLIFFHLIMDLIAMFQYFTQAFVMTGGGPIKSTLFYGLYLYQNAFQYLKMGYASAQAWLLCLMVLGLTVLLFRTSGWVFYGGARE